MKKYMPIVCLGVFLEILFLFWGCTNSQNAEKRRDKKQANFNMLLELEGERGNKNSELKSYYIIPSPLYDILLNPQPKVANDITNSKRIFDDIISKDITSKDTIIEYLDQKRQYAKTNIFSKIP